MPPSTQSASADGIGRRGNGRRPEMVGVPAMQRKWVKAHPRDLPKGGDECQTRRLLRPWKHGRLARGNLALAAPMETWGRWTAQACNGALRGRCLEQREAAVQQWIDRAR